MLKIQMIFNELITTCPLSNHIKIITNFVGPTVGVVPPFEEGDPPLK